MNKPADKLAGLTAEQKKQLAQKLKGKKALHLFPLSYAQQRMWFLHRLAPDSPVYNLPFALKIKGRLNRDIFEQTLKKIIRRHEILRTTFREIKGEVRQVVAPVSAIKIVYPELDGQPVEELIRQQAMMSFNLEKGPLGVISLIQTAEAEHVMVMVMHHIISDGWSMGLLIREFTIIYDALSKGAEPALPPLKIQYADFAQWQKKWLQGKRLQEQLDFWRSTLTSNPPVLELMGDKPRPKQLSSRGGQIYRTLNLESWHNLKALAGRFELTDFMLLIGAFYLLLHRYTRQDDICIGTPVANRNRAETEALIGFFVNTLVMRCSFSENDTLEAFFGKVKETALSAMAHQDIPFEMLVQELQPARDMSRSPLFQAFFTHTPSTGAMPELGDLSFEPIEFNVTTAKFEISLFTQETENELNITLEYNSDLFSKNFVEHLADHFMTLLKQLQQPQLTYIHEIDLLSEKEKARILHEWNHTQREYPPPRPLLALFEEQAQRHPRAVALRFEGAEMSYALLNDKAARLAARLQSLGAGPEQFIGLCMERSPELVIAMYAILKTGAAYVPLDPGYPQERLRYMIEDSQAEVIITQKHLSDIEALQGKTIVVADEMPKESALSPAPVRIDVDNAAYMIYTSGSTGKPKGVVISHRAIWNRLQWMQETYGLKPGEKVLQKTPYSFDVSVWEFFWPLQYGATLVLAKADGHKDPAYLQKLIVEEKISTVHFVPSMLQAFVNSADLSACVSLKRVICSGEALSRELVQQFYRYSHAELHNLYGPTEAAVDVTWWHCRAEDSYGSTPIGRPIANTQIYITDSRHRLLPAGVAGELVIGGVQLARNYHRRPQLTAEKFIADPYSSTPGARLYRTGDLARFMDNGAIEFLGRIDHQVKLRGLRIELGEIENALKGLEHIADAVVLVKTFGAHDQRLVAYIQTKEETDTSYLQNELARRLPEYMVPSLFVPVEAIPLLPSGKVDRRALLSVEVAYSQQKEYIAPRTPAEEIISQIFCDLLNVPQAGATDHFFELGGHSLLATQLLSRIRDNFQVELPLQILFETPTVEGLAAAIEQARLKDEGLEVPPIVAVPRDGKIPLSFAQQRMWFLDQLEPGSPLYNIPNAVRMTGTLDIDALEAGLNEIIKRHEVLRTSIATVDGEAVLNIYKELTIKIPIVDLSRLGQEEQEKEISRLAQEEATKPFKLDTAPLLRATLLKLKNDDYIFLFVMHHIVSDGWSTGVLIRELVPLYSAFRENKPSPLPPLKIQYADFAQWQRQWLSGKVLDEHLEYWRKQLEDAPPYLELPTDKPRPAVQTFNGARRRFYLNKELTDKLKHYAREKNATLFMTLLAAYQILLYRYSGQDDISVGTPIAGRNRSEIEPLIGFFVNTLVMRTKLSGNSSFRELLDRVRKVVLGAFAHQDLPFEKLIDLLNIKRDVSRTPLFQTMFALQNIPQTKIELPDLTLSEIIPENPTSKFEITLEMAESQDGVLGGIFEYNADLFEPSTIDRFIQHFKRLLEHIVQEPDAPVAALNFISEAEKTQLLEEWNATDRPFPQEVTFAALFSEQVRTTPDAIAVVFKEEQLTYRELNQQANQLANFLRQHNIGPEKTAGIALNRSVQMLVAVLGVLKSGAAYVPIDPHLPADRLSYILEDAGVNILLTQQDFSQKFTENQATCISLDSDWPEVAKAPANEPQVNIRPEHLAYIIYTSGSTGKPKGTLIEHRSLTNYLHWINQSPFGAAGQFMPQITKLSFDASLKQLLAPLLRGDTVWLVPEALLQEPALFLNEIAQKEKVHLNCVPTLWQAILDSAGQATDANWRKSLTALALGGEAINPELIKRSKQELPHLEIYNLYGPSEATANASYAAISSGDEITIGKPIANTRFYVLDTFMQPVPVGVPGELYIGGVGLSRGYLHRPDLTADTFLPDPFSSQPGARMYKSGDLVRFKSDGNVEFLGRLDHQVKIRGFRVELGEIEAALAQHEAVGDCVVTARKDRPGLTRLTAYIVPQNDAKPAVTELREYLKKHLPDYMVPSFFIIMEKFPLTSSGKLDRRALPEPADVHPESAADYKAPSSENENILAGIWQELLGIKRIGINDNFFELGGDSILSIQMIARARQHGLQITPVQIFKHQTIAELATVAASAPVIEAEQGEVTGPVPLTPIQKRFFEKQFPNPHHWNQSLMLEVKEKLDSGILRKVVARLLEHHDALRLRFLQEDGLWRQENAPVDQKIPFEVVDLSELPGHKQKETLSEKAAAFQRSLNLSEGPIARVIYFNMGETNNDRILIIVHHLAMDGISWRILLEDLQAAYQQLAAGREAQLPPKSTSFKRWAEKISAYARGEQLAAEKEFWLTMAAKPAVPLPVDRPDGTNDEQNVSGITVSLSEEETKALLQDVPPVYNTQINDILLTALVRGFSRWTGKRSLLIDLEGHGRENLFDDADISRTIGWFTAVYPVFLNLGNAVHPGDAIKAVKEQLKRIPNKGIGFGLLRYLSSDSHLQEQLKPLEQGQVTFNYLGQFDQALPENSPFIPAAEAKGADHDPACRRSSLIDISGSIAGGRLHMRFSFSENLYLKATIDALAANYMDELRGLIKHCQDPQAGGRTASDFDLAKLDDKKLDKIMAQLQKKKKKKK